MSPDEKRVPDSQLPGTSPPNQPLPQPRQSPTPQGEPPALKTSFRGWAYRKFGVRGLIILAVFSIAGLTWWNWPTVKDLPGVPTVVLWVNRWVPEKPLPKADPRRFSVAVARLQNDKDRQHEGLILEALKEFQGIELLRFDRRIYLLGSKPQEAEKNGHAKARGYLKESGAQVLIWGTVIKRGGQSLQKLYWTPSRDLKLRKPWGRYRPTEDLNLPKIFWKDLVQVLRLLVVTHEAEFWSQAQKGHLEIDKLHPFIDKVRQLLGASKGRGWNAQTRDQIRLVLAASLNGLGISFRANAQRESETAGLEKRIALFREALKLLNRLQMPFQWALTMNNLALELGALGRREHGTARFEEAEKGFREALTELPKEPLVRAGVLANLANTLLDLGLRRKDSKFVCEAIEKRAASWNAFSAESPQDAAMSIKSIRKDIVFLKKHFEQQEVRACLQKHAEILKRILKEKPQ